MLTGWVSFNDELSPARLAPDMLADNRFRIVGQLI
jgi:hypothetical protein